MSGNPLPGKAGMYPDDWWIENAVTGFLAQNHWHGNIQIGYHVVLVFNTSSIEMPTTSISLGEHWEVFIKNEIASGRYNSASEVVRDALRTLEERKNKLAALRSHLAEGVAQAERGEFVTVSLDEMLREFREEQDGKFI